MSSKPSIPSWQRDQPTTPPVSSATPHSEPESPLDQSSESHPTSSPGESTRDERTSGKSDLLEQASKFLEDPTIRDASRERKAAFLESKGVDAEDINTLLGSEVEHTTVDVFQEGERVWAKTPKQPPAPVAPAGSQTRDIPPIVTYPEFLTQATKPPPIMTTRRLLSTAYISGGLLASMYGLSKYIIAPMTEDLAETRHDFALHAKEKLDSLNSQLETTVSTDPASKPRSNISDMVDDISEADSDPTELFHRDFGTQTTPSLSRRPSTSTSVDAQHATIKGHEDRLKILTSHLQELEATRSNDSASSGSLKTNLSDLTAYLSEMSYQNQYYTGMGNFYGSNYGQSKSKDGKEDQIEVLKAEIRAVKGVFLSARNFPAGGPRTAGTAGA